MHRTTGSSSSTKKKNFANTRSLTTSTLNSCDLKGVKKHGKRERTSDLSNKSEGERGSVWFKARSKRSSILRRFRSGKSSRTCKSVSLLNFDPRLKSPRHNLMSLKHPQVQSLKMAIPKIIKKNAGRKRANSFQPVKSKSFYEENDTCTALGFKVVLRRKSCRCKNCKRTLHM